MYCCNMRTKGTSFKYSTARSLQKKMGVMIPRMKEKTKKELQT